MEIRRLLMVGVPPVGFGCRAMTARINGKHVETACGKVRELLLPHFCSHHQSGYKHQIVVSGPSFEVVHSNVANLRGSILERLLSACRTRDQQHHHRCADSPNRTSCPCFLLCSSDTIHRKLKLYVWKSGEKGTFRFSSLLITIRVIKPGKAACPPIVQRYTLVGSSVKLDNSVFSKSWTEASRSQSKGLHVAIRPALISSGGQQPSVSVGFPVPACWLKAGLPRSDEIKRNIVTSYLPSRRTRHRGSGRCGVPVCRFPCRQRPRHLAIAAPGSACGSRLSV